MVDDTKPVEKQITIEDIAEAANVGIATVSRTLNHPEIVREKTREKILSVVHELGYIRSGAARALASKQTHTIGAIIPTLNNAIFAASIAGFERELSKENYTLLITVTNYDREQETIQLHNLLERGVDAVLLIGQDHTKRSYSLLEKSKCCVVSIFGSRRSKKIPNIGFNNNMAAEKIVDHLVSLGHETIGMIAGITKDNDRARDRKNGVIKALQKHDLQHHTSLFLESPYSHPHGREAFKQLYSHSLKPTAIICGNDVLAMGVMFEADAQGVKIPNQLSVTGFDNLPITEHLKPALTTIDVPSEKMGTEAAKAIITNLSSGTKIKSGLLEAKLLIRNTTRPKSVVN